MEKIKTRILSPVRFPENFGVCEIMWKNIAVPDRTHDKMAQARFMLGI